MQQELIHHLDKFVPVPVDLTKLINVVKSHVVKKMYLMLR